MTSARRRRAAGIWATCAVAAGLIAGGCDRAGTPPRSPANVYPVREYELASGFRLVIEEDDTSPVAGVVLVVDAGLIDDSPGKSGLAHTVEHLAFSAPAATGSSLWRTMSQVGAGGFNASTGLDTTKFYAFVPQASLDDLVAAMTARAGDPMRGIDDALLAKEMAVVAEECKARSDVNARWRALAAVLPPGEVYTRVYLGRQPSGTLTLADVRAFADRHYRPERMTMVISGAIGKDADKNVLASLAPSLRGAAGERTTPVRRPIAVARVTAALRPQAALPIVKTSVVGPELWMAWPLPPARGLGTVSLNVTARVAGRMLAERQDRGPSALLDVDVSALAGSQSGAFIVRARLRAADDAAHAREEIAAFMSSLSTLSMRFPGPGVLAGYRRAVREASLEATLAMESLSTRALVRADAVHRGSGAQIAEILRAMRNVGADDVASFADRYLTREAARSALVLPDEAAARDRVAPSPLRAASLPAEATGDSEPTLDDTEGDAAVDGVPIDAIASSPGARHARVTTLANGLTVIAMRRPGLPVATVLLGFHGEPQPGEAPGIRAALPRTVLWDLSEPSDLGILHLSAFQPDSYQEKLLLFSSDLDNALDLIGEQPAHLQVHWPSPRFERWIARAAQGDTTPPMRAWRGFRGRLLGDHPYTAAPTIDAVRKVTGADIEGWVRHNRRPSNGALVIVGDIDLDEVSRRTERLSRDWKGDPAPVPPPPAPPIVPTLPGARPHVQFVQDAGRRATEIRFGCLLPPIDDLAADVRSDVLATVIQEDLRRGLRFKLGASYAPNVAASTMRGGTAVLQGSFDLEAEALPEALDLLRVWLDPERAVPLKAAAFERARREQAKRSAFHTATNGSVARDLFYAWNLGWRIDALDEYPAVMARMRVADVEADLRACRASSVVSVVGAGPPPAVVSSPSSNGSGPAPP